MEMIKRHKGLAIICLLAAILLLIIFIIFSRMIFSNGNTEYGDRLDNIVEVKQSVIKEVIGKTKEYEEVENITVRTQGKIIYTTITFTEKTSKDKAKEIAANTLESYSEEIIECYDFEFILTQKERLNEEGKDEAFTIAGTKHPKREKISWTRN